MSPKSEPTQDQIFTIGHSTHPIEEFIGILNAFNIEKIIDVRTIPKSRHNPQFGDEALAKSLKEQNIGYQRIERLGGLRKTSKDSINTAWNNASFRGYADYMQTAEFTEGLTELTDQARTQTIAIMCAEAVPWRCHRSLIGDALLIRNVEVLDIMSKTSAKPHKLTGWAKVDGLTITYPGE